MTSPSSTERLRANPAFVMACTFDGRPYVARDAEPYDQFWLSERERLLLALFARRGGLTAADAVDAWCRLGGRGEAAERRRALKAVAAMRAAGVLLAPADDTSRYDARIAAHYVEHRPFPPEVAQHIAEAAAIGPATRVMDVAGGPGDLALALAQRSKQVTLLELSHGFLAAARKRARAQGLALATVHDSANRLPWRDDEQDVVTVSQALHWLDDVAVCRGVCRLLAEGGHFFVVHAAMDLPDAHPLAWLLGPDSILGAKPRKPFADELAPLANRLAGLFDALDAPEVARIDPSQARGGPRPRIACAGVTLFRQTRPFDAGFARGFLTPRHVAASGMAEAALWAEVEARCAGAAAKRLLGTQHWAVLHFRRGAAGARPDIAALRARSIGYRSAAS